MITIFHMFVLCGALVGFMLLAPIGSALGRVSGHEWLDWTGYVVGGAAGLVLGYVIGHIPFWLTSWRLRRQLERSDVATLRARLTRDYFISHLIIANLVIRGEPIESFRDDVAELLGSDCPDKRRFGELVTRIWPETLAPSPPSYASDEPRNE